MPAPGTLRAWGLAARHRTLVAGLVPIAVGSGVAIHDGKFHPLVMLAALVAALLIQIGTNLANDYHDFRRGADSAGRLGPPRVSALGLLPPRAVLYGALTCFGLAILVGIYLVAVGGWPILAIGLASVTAGYIYTGGPYPLAYHGLGEVFVLVFFGLIAVGGTYFVQALSWSPIAVVAGIPVGMLAVGLLTVNNVRDSETDAAARKRTLVVRLGTGFGRAEYVASLAISFLVPVFLVVTGQAGPFALLPLLSVPLAVAPVRIVQNERGGALNQALAGTAKLQLAFGALFALGLAL